MTKKGHAAHRSVVPPENVDSPQRRKDILRAAAELFAMSGYDGVSLRSIAERANVPVGLCTYYFGRKPDLYSSLFEHNRDKIEERIVLLNNILENPGSSSVRELVSGWITPVFHLLDGGNNERFAILIARAVWDTAEASKQAIEAFYDPVAFAFIDALAALLPDRSRSDLIWGYEWALGALLMHLADERVIRLSNGTEQPRNRQKQDLLINFITSGLTSIPPAAIATTAGHVGSSE